MKSLVQRHFSIPSGAGAPISSPVESMTRDPLVRSTRTLALFAMQASGADGYAAYASETDGGPELRHASGIPIADGEGNEPVDGGDVSVVSYSIRADGVEIGRLYFAFRGPGIDPEKLAILDRMAALIETVEANHRNTARLASKVGALETELAAIKIAERAQGLLDGAFEPSSVETLAKHVATVLEGRQAAGALEDLLRELEDRVDERKLLVRAKGLLQRAYGISEEQAYLQLRVRSRTSRKRLRVIAGEVIGAALERGCLKEQEV